MTLRPWILLAGSALVAAAQSAAPSQNLFAATSAQVRDLTKRVSRAVVEIEVTGYGAAGDHDPLPAATVIRQQALGSGVILDPGGYIVTNAHVVAGAIDVKVLLSATPQDDDSDALLQQLDANIIGVDRESDLALLKVNATGLPALAFAPMDSLQQGDLVLAVGNPNGLRNSASLGLVSATARSIGETDPFGYIQTDASINPGNSGGALVDAEGRLVGINTFILSRSGGNEGLGFAIPSSVVEEVVRQLREKGHVDRGKVGVVAEDITPDLSAALSLSRSRGVILADVQPETPAAAAGLQIGDILLSVDGRRAISVTGFRSYIYAKRPGDKMQLEVLREGNVQRVSITLQARPASFDPLAALASPEQHLIARLGVLGIEIDRSIAAVLGDLREQSGVLVAARAAEGLGQFIDLQPGDVIHAINGTPVASLDFLRSKVQELPSGAPVALQVERDGQMLYVAFQIE